MKLQELFEAVGEDVWYHATGPGVDTLESIIKNGLKTNTNNLSRNRSELNSISFTRSLRYALTSMDDDGTKIDGVANGVVLVFNRSKLKQTQKTKSVAHSDLYGLIYRVGAELKKRLANASTAKIESKVMLDREMMSMLNDTDGATDQEEAALVAAGKELKLAFTVNGMKAVLMVAIKPFYDSPSSESLKSVLSTLSKLQAAVGKNGLKSKSTTENGSAGSEYEEVILTKQSFVPLSKLGFLGFVLNPKLDDEKKEAIRALFQKSFGKNIERTK